MLYENFDSIKIKCKYIPNFHSKINDEILFYLLNIGKFQLNIGQLVSYSPMWYF